MKRCLILLLVIPYLAAENNVQSVIKSCLNSKPKPPVPPRGTRHGGAGPSHGGTGTTHGSTGPSHGGTGTTHGSAGPSHGGTGAPPPPPNLSVKARVARTEVATAGFFQGTIGNLNELVQRELERFQDRGLSAETEVLCKFVDQNLECSTIKEKSREEAMKDYLQKHGKQVGGDFSPNQLLAVLSGMRKQPRPSANPDGAGSSSE